MELLERDRELAVVAARYAEAAEGRGAVVLVSGEGGIGKSSLVEAMLDRLPDDARTLVGACEDLLASQAFGPLRDLRLGADSPLRAALDGGGDREVVLAALLEEVRDPLRTVVLVLEDLHWADDATLDAVRVLGRRVHRMRGLLVATYRDALPTTHPLRAVLGVLTGRHVERLALAPLSEDAVRRLAAGRDVDDGAVARIRDASGGNPFLVAELIGHEGDGVPPTVTDVVVARLAELDEATREAVELVAVVPGTAAWPLLEHLDPSTPDALARAEPAGLLEAGRDGVRFRHDLGRHAVLDQLPAGRRRALHGAVLDALLALDAPRAHLVHHAVAAGRADVLRAHGEAVAAEASRLGSRRQAVEVLEHLVRPATGLPDARRAAALAWLTWELTLLGRPRRGLERADEAVALCEALGDDAGLAMAHAGRSSAAYWSLDPDTSRRSAETAVAVAEGGDDVPATVRCVAHVQLALLHAAHEEHAAALASGEAALSLVAGEVGSRHLRLATAVRASARLALGDRTAEADLRGVVDEALGVGAAVDAAVACIGLLTALHRADRLEDGATVLDRVIEQAADHEFVVGADALRTFRGDLRMRLGRTREAEADLVAALGAGERRGWGDTVARALLARLAARAGALDAVALAEEAWAAAARSRELRTVVPAAVALLECAWLVGDVDDVVDRTHVAHALAGRHGHGWFLGQLVRYARLAGVELPTPAVPTGPWGPSLARRHAEAAAGFARRGWPYERALDLLLTGGEEEADAAVATLDELGFEATAREARRRLRALGVRSVPRGPTAATRANPAGLTPRQAEVLTLVTGGATNADVADQLVLSVRTVDRHVSALLQKLGVRSRGELAAAAASAGLDLG